MFQDTILVGGGELAERIMCWWNVPPRSKDELKAVMQISKAADPSKQLEEIRKKLELEAALIAQRSKDHENEALKKALSVG